ncbi:hypothetical protein BDF21DRAFT_461606 [Thamnidium elegans]|uniref:Uncharacterized protein n=1 Tax=Thamnidium elegans TaxID=101142 RepID=A0A8H7STY6_9FUNG|nr:hypothetical protein INT48_007245 [Thamnidium elegans]KAI8085705.1 hypothetical protein BDF21DRAFT_461606 [Thamnidium elegans]
MDDTYQPFSQRESYEYFMIQQPTTSSPTSTSTASSPITIAMQSVSTGTNWPTRIFPLDSTMNQYEYDYSQRTHNPVWSLPHPQQHNIMTQPNYQQQLHNQLHYQQQHLIFRSHPDMHHSIYQNYDQVSQDLFQVPTLPAEIYYAPQEQHNVLHGVETQLNANIPIYTDSSNDKPSDLTFKIEPMTETNVQQDLESTISPLPSITKLNRESVSPNTTPLSSPVLSSTRKRKRVGKATATCTNSSLSQLGNSVVVTDEEERGVKRTKQEEGVDGGTKEVGVQGSRKTVDQLERELDFLGDDCDTILMMLDSLRNAFLADIPASQLKSTSKGIPLTSTFDSKEKSHIDQVTYAKNLTNHVPTIINTRRRSKIIAQNPEMEREIRTAYDDLMIQVRQVEKKVDALEGKRKNAFHVDKEKNKGKASIQLQSDNEEEDTYSQSSCALSSLISEEEEEDYLLETTKKRKITSTKG